MCMVAGHVPLIEFEKAILRAITFDAPSVLREILHGHVRACRGFVLFIGPSPSSCLSDRSPTPISCLVKSPSSDLSQR